MGLRVGIGYDSHRLVEGKRLVIGGVEIEHDRGLTGHSDADVLTHAVIDALLGASGLGDLGELFPTTRRNGVMPTRSTSFGWWWAACPGGPQAST